MSSKILVFDGDCGVCTKLSEIGEKLSRNVEVIDGSVADLREFGINDYKSFESILYIRDGQIFDRTRAVFEFMKETKYGLSIIGYLFSNKLATTIFNPLYNSFARNRTTISKFLGLTACKVNFATDQSLRR